MDFRKLFTGSKKGHPAMPVVKFDARSRHVLQPSHREPLDRPVREALFHHTNGIEGVWSLFKRQGI
jgi:hypothetical protein